MIRTYPPFAAAALRRARSCALLLPLLLTAACGGRQAAPADPLAPPPAMAIAPMDLGGQRVLVLPVQATSGVEGGRDRATTELMFALRDRDTRTPWLDPDALRAALRRSPNYAPDPGTLPADRFEHYRERRIAEPLLGIVRRYSALMNARLVLIPREARFLPMGEGGEGMVRMRAAMVDARTGLLVWYGDADGAVAPPGDPALLPSAAASLATRLTVSDSQ
jgi:hypothetical protein